MKPTVLLAARISTPFRAALAQHYEVIGPVAEPFDQEVRGLPGADAARVQAIVTFGSVRISDAGLAALPALRLVCCIGSGYEGIALAAARARGVSVTHSPNANAASVADIAIGLLIACVRNLPAGRERLRGGQWKGNAADPNKAVLGLTGRKVGIYGLGAIGLKIAQRASTFEMEVAYHNRKPRPDLPYAYHASLLELAKWASVLMIAVRAGPENRHAVNREILAALGPDGHVVNISRGSVIDEAALIEALQTGVICGAGLDVFEHEPKVPEILLQLPYVAVTPHLGGATLDSQLAMQNMVLTNLAAHFSGGAVPNPVPE